MPWPKLYIRQRNLGTLPSAGTFSLKRPSFLWHYQNPTTLGPLPALALRCKQNKKHIGGKKKFFFFLLFLFLLFFFDPLFFSSSSRSLHHFSHHYYIFITLTLLFSHITRVSSSLFFSLSYAHNILYEMIFFYLKLVCVWEIKRILMLSCSCVLSYNPIIMVYVYTRGSMVLINMLQSLGIKWQAITTKADQDLAALLLALLGLNYDKIIPH